MNLPTKITISRIIAIVLMVLALIVLWIIGLFVPNFAIPNIGNSNINWLYFALFLVFVVAASTDWLDGYLARKNNQVTDLGKFLDPIADKLLINSLLIFLAVPQLYASSQMSIPVFCVIIFIARDLVVDGLRLIAAKKQEVIAANIFGKLKTVLQMVAIGLVLLNGWPFSYFDASWINEIRIANLFVYLATIVSVVSGVIYIIENRKVLKKNV